MVKMYAWLSFLLWGETVSQQSHATFFGARRLLRTFCFYGAITPIYSYALLGSGCLREIRKLFKRKEPRAGVPRASKHEDV